jgi:hypothetical protein
MITIELEEYKIIKINNYFLVIEGYKIIDSTGEKTKNISQ